jgi:hypothetical protein
MFQSSGSSPESFFELKRIDFRVDLMIGERRPASRLVKLRSYLVDARPTKQTTSFHPHFLSSKLPGFEQK